ncbi:MAG: hypothetical protein ACLSVD_02930 [Eggerthellaceae bacterium]
MRHDIGVVAARIDGPLAAFCAWVLVGVYGLLRDEWEAKRKDDDR